MPVIIKDMVRKAKISPSTVSWVLKNHVPIVRIPVERIRRLAREGNYTRSQFTRGLNSDHSSS